MMLHLKLPDVLSGGGRRDWLSLRLIAIVLMLVGSDGLTQARTVDFAILHTTDLHGYIWPTTDYDGRTNVGGFLRCAARIDDLRQQFPRNILIDCGDTFQGSPESWLTQGRLIVDGLNVMQYDAWVLGNHEIDWGPQALRKLHDKVEIPFLAANLHFHDPSKNWLPKIQPFVIKEIEGIRIAIIGLTTPGIPRWSRPHLLDGAMFKRSVETLTDLMPSVKAQQPDVIIVAVHQGYKHRGDDFANEINALANRFPEIDVLLGGHTHTTVEEMKMGPVLYSQAGYHGIWLGRVEVTYDTVKRAVIAKRAYLEVMDETIPYHEGLRERWKKELDAADRELSRPAGMVPHKLEAKPDTLGRSSMQQFVSQAIADGTQADFVLHGSLAEEPIESGPIALRDVWRIVPYENTIGLVSLTPQQIGEVLLENFARPLTHQSMGPYGFSFTISGSGKERQIIEMRDAAGAPLHARKRYRVALNSYVLASGGERYPNTRRLAELPESRLTMLDVDTRALVIKMLKSSRPANDQKRQKPVLAD